MSKLTAWMEQRHLSVIGPQGDLSLIQMYEITAGKTVEEVGGIWSPLTDNMPGLMLVASAEDQLSINGELVVGQHEIVADITVVTAANGRTMMATSQPNSNHLLAIWDDQAETLKNFKAIDHYEQNTEAIIEGVWLPDEEEQTFSFAHTSDQEGTSRQHVSPGSIAITYDGEEYKLRPFAAGNQYIIVFRDATSGSETYGTGRMLVVKPDANGHVTLDFNYAFLPPCAFSVYFNCPMPPFSNRIRSKMEAGEKNVLMNN